MGEFRCLSSETNERIALVRFYSIEGSAKMQRQQPLWHAAPMGWELQVIIISPINCLDSAKLSGVSQK